MESWRRLLFSNLKPLTKPQIGWNFAGGHLIGFSIEIRGHILSKDTIRMTMATPMKSNEFLRLIGYFLMLAGLLLILWAITAAMIGG